MTLCKYCREIVGPLQGQSGLLAMEPRKIIFESRLTTTISPEFPFLDLGSDFMNSNDTGVHLQEGGS